MVEERNIKYVDTALVHQLALCGCMQTQTLTNMKTSRVYFFLNGSNFPSVFFFLVDCFVLVWCCGCKDGIRGAEAFGEKLGFDEVFEALDEAIEAVSFGDCRVVSLGERDDAIRLGLFGDRSKLENRRDCVPGEDGGVSLLFTLLLLFIFENSLRLLFLSVSSIVFFGNVVRVSVTSNPSWIMLPGIGLKGPTYLKKVSSTPSPSMVQEMVDATSSIVVCTELLPLMAASWSPCWTPCLAPLPSGTTRDTQTLS